MTKNIEFTPMKKFMEEKTSEKAGDKKKIDKFLPEKYLKDYFDN